MNNLKLEVVRFGSEDVIATSFYLTKRTEAIEGNIDVSYDYPDAGGNWVRFYWENSGEKFVDYVINNPSAWSMEDLPYAWYDGGQWTSEGKAWNTYSVFPE
ncbi:MAG: hypothetical protein J6Z79_02640 [Clostridia bacterium]|nr:hypothetical protein [Clostridia bacterium]